MDLKLLSELNQKHDKEFAENHLDFVLWWSKHRDNDPNPKYAIPARIAYKCAVFYDEFWEMKNIGAI